MTARGAIYNAAWEVEVEITLGKAAEIVEALASAGFQITDQALVAQEREAREKAINRWAEERSRAKAAEDRCAELEAERLTPFQAKGVLVALDFGVPDPDPPEIVEAIAKLRALASSPSGEETRERNEDG